MCEAYAKQRGFHIKGGKLDVHRAANQLLRDALNGHKVFEKELSAVNAAVVNEAYKMLKTPNTRVKYLLALHGIDALSETASTAVDPRLLLQTMEIRERIEDASSLADLDALRVEISAQIDAVIGKLGEAYDQKKDLDATRQLAVELQYMVKCAEEIDHREEQLEGEA
ncbi:hypothetical protein ATCC90586_006757 [Pythium insidiosum]|nr:hypothetical protein ATCC90586_006757 [Pythium insidiosum]